MEKTKLILDIDSVGDDILAVLYTLHNPKADLLGITTVTGAAGGIEQAAWVAMDTVEIAECFVPVYAGASEPLKKEEAKESDGDPVNFFDPLRDKFGSRLDEMNTPAWKPEHAIEKEHAVDYLVRMFNKYPGEITLITTGPLTNIALALQKDPSIAQKVKKAYILGGSYHIWGNISPVTEYNIFADPEAADMVLQSSMDIVLVPLDVCENNAFADSMLTRDHLYELSMVKGNRMIDYICRKYPIYIDVWRDYFNLGGFPMDDVITAALATDPELCECHEKVHVAVELEGKYSRGQIIPFYGCQINSYPERSVKNVSIVKSLKGKDFMDLFTSTLIQGASK